MDVLLVPIGSAGDINPFIGLGLALRARGHRVRVITNGPYQSLVQGAGLDFIAIAKDKREGDAHSGLRGVAGRLLRPLGRRWKKLARSSTYVPLLRPLYEAIIRHTVPGQTVVVAGTAALGARVAHDKLGVPLVTVHLSPVLFRSIHRPPVQPPLPLPAWSPHWYRRAVYWLLDKLVIDPLLGRPTNALRAELGLPPVRRLFAGWRHAPQRVIGMFPDWFAQLQPDWPAQTRLTGFCFYDQTGHAEVPEEVQQFLDAGEPPIVFTPGSAMKNGSRFLRESAAACEMLGRRGLLLTRFRDQVPERLPQGVRHFDYLPFSQVLPRAAALVHHGGIGSAAQALAAGIPQLLMPMRHDQPDNARRLEGLGVARTIEPRAYRAPAVAQALDHLLKSEEVATCCRQAAVRLASGNDLATACELIEQLCPTAVPQAA